MNLWHLTPDAPRSPHRVSAGERVTLEIGTWPIEPGQAVWVTVRTNGAGALRDEVVEAHWHNNAGTNSYWRAELGPFSEGDRVDYGFQGRSPAGETTGPEAAFEVGPKLFLALLWHQHQPLYRAGAAGASAGSRTEPWVRLHALRDYYSMAALVADHPDVHLTINLTPVLLQQIEDYAERGASDRALELTTKPAGRLAAVEREEMLGTFFDADWHNQIFPHPRYRELFRLRQERGRPAVQDLRDLQMWFNLAWFGKEFRDGEVTLVTGETASVRRFVEQGRGFALADIRAMVTEQHKILRAVAPIHRMLMERGQIELSTTPFHHPILPPLIDTDAAAIDRPGATHPRRFAHPEDADAQVRLAVEQHERFFGRRPRGMWPAEGAVSQAAIPLFARPGVRWIATDAGVLARSGRWGYRADDPNVLCQPYRVEEGGSAVSVFFRDTALSDRIGFWYQRYGDGGAAAREFLAEIKERFVRRIEGDGDRVLTVVLDGENAWGGYRDDARPFLHALYELLAQDHEVRTVTFTEYLEGAPARRLRPHPGQAQAQVFGLFPGSWIDEFGSAPGVDLGTWIGEPEENRAWDLLGRVRDELAGAIASRESPADPVHALYAAEGSDWFWWLGQDQESGNDPVFDDLFRAHLAEAYRSLGATVPRWLEDHLVPRAVTWTFAQPVDVIQPGDRLVVRTNCPGTLTWRAGDRPAETVSLAPVGGVMAGVGRCQITLGPFDEAVRVVRFRFRCAHPACDHRDRCCRGEEHAVGITEPRPV